MNHEYTASHSLPAFPLWERLGAKRRPLAFDLEVAESGGILSHSSIIAREYNIPAVVSVAGALQLPDMAKITVDGFKGEVLIHEALPLELQPIPEQASDPENIN